MEGSERSGLVGSGAVGFVLETDGGVGGDVGCGDGREEEGMEVSERVACVVR